MTEKIEIAEIQKYLERVALDKSDQTVDAYDLALRKFIEFFKIENFDQFLKITTSDCEDWQSYLVGKKMKMSSVNQYFRSMKVFYNYLLKGKKITFNPFSEVLPMKTPKEVIHVLTPEEITALFNACEKVDDKLILSLLLTVGLRRDELVNLKLTDISDDHILINGKGKKQRFLPLTPQVVKILNVYLVYRNEKYGNKTEYLLVSKMGSKYSGEAIRLRIQAIGTRAGFSEKRLKEIHVHLLRHGFCSWLIESGVNMRVVQELMGHASINTTMIYAHVSNNAMDNAILGLKPIF